MASAEEDKSGVIHNSPVKMDVMSLNASKAGMEGLDKCAIDAVIAEASKGSKFYAAKAKSQERIDARADAMRQKLKHLRPESIEAAEQKADLIAKNFKNYEKRLIVHVDMDAFYAAVEERDDPSLKGKPMAVGSTGMLSTSNYLARRFGVRAGMPGFIGKKLCPQLTIVAPNFDKYRAVSTIVRDIFRHYDGHFCPMSLDEAYLDLTTYMASTTLTVEQVVEEMRQKIFEQTNLTASAGIAPNPMLAKVCSDKNKPNGQFRLQDDVVGAFMADLPVRKIGGIGNVTEQLLHKVLGIETCSHLYDNRGLLYLLFSESSATSFLRISLGVDTTLVAHMAQRDRKSMSNETTFRDSSDPSLLLDTCNQLCEDLSNDLKKEGMKGRQVTVKIKTHRYSVKTRVYNLLGPTCDLKVIQAAAKNVLHQFMAGAEEKPLTLRLLGVRMSELSSSHYEGDDDDDDVASIFYHQPTLEKFVAADAHHVTFSCPICGMDVKARSEVAFNTVHLDSCLLKVDDNNDGDEEYDNGASNFQESSSRVVQLGNGPEAKSSSSSCKDDCTKDDLGSDNAYNDVEFSSSSSSKNVTASVHTTEERTAVVCPVCSIVIDASERDVNGHIDECLSRQTISELVGCDKKRKLSSNHVRKSSTNNKRPRNNSILKYFG